jgi:hypothetical protein
MPSQSRTTEIMEGSDDDERSVEFDIIRGGKQHYRQPE